VIRPLIQRPETVPFLPVLDRETGIPRRTNVKDKLSFIHIHSISPDSGPAPLGGIADPAMPDGRPAPQNPDGQCISETEDRRRQML
jgi:hypothetical protein